MTEDDVKAFLALLVLIAVLGGGSIIMASCAETKRKQERNRRWAQSQYAEQNFKGDENRTGR